MRDIVTRIDEWADVRADHLAHVSQTRAVTYGELKARSDALASHLMTRLPDDRSPVAVLGHKEPEMLIAFLGCVKAGHPYIPLDASLPAHRIADIMATANAQLTLTPAAVDHASAVPVSVRRRPLSPSDTFYILFTSGSTGIPKGVPITLGCLTDFVSWMEDEQRFGDREVFLNQVPYSFDVSVMDTYLALLSGGTVFSITRQHIDNPIQLYQALSASAVTIWVSTPAFVQMCLVERRFDQRMLPRLQRFFLAGESLSPALVRQLFDRFPGASVWNMYGPTEATVVVTSVRITRNILDRYPVLPIGLPKPRTRITVVNGDDRPVGPGERGEIVLAGPNVSPGYLNRPEATERAFCQVDGVHSYRTGDIGHFEDGLLFFDGRIDSQIKLHGYRIEPGDIEAHLSALPEIQDVAVLPVNKNGRVDSIQAFVVLHERPAGSDYEISNNLRARLAERLPAHMLPRKFRFLDTFPMTVNGKVDRRRLAELG